MKLSQAIRTGASPDTLDAAMDALNLSQGDMLHEPYCRLRIRELHRAFPHLGASVRQCPTLALKLESLRMLPRIKPFQTAYHQEVHRSLWKVITDLHDTVGWANSDIAVLLEDHGL